MNQLEMTAEPRTVRGKKVRHLRQQGWVPANVYGHGIDSYPIQVEAKQLEPVLRRAGTSKLIGLRLPSRRGAQKVLVRQVQLEPLTGKPVHVAFYQVRMTEKLRAEVHLRYVGEAPAASAGQGLLLRNLSSVEVECLPGDLPEAIPVDVSGLESLSDAVHIRDLAVPAGVTILADPEELVAKVAPVRVEREVVEEKVEEERVEAAPPPVEQMPEITGEETA